MTTDLIQRIRVIPSADLAALGFEPSAAEYEYIGPSNQRGRALKRYGRFPGYSLVRNVRTGQQKRMRNDLIQVVTR